MFEYKHYVPVLRWKQAEWLSVRELSQFTKNRITPIVEPTPRKFNDYTRQKARDMLQLLMRNWGSNLIFIDCHLIAESSQESLLRELFSLNSSVNLVPVTGLNRPFNYQRVVEDIVQETETVVLRVTVDDILSSGFTDRVHRLLHSLNIQLNQVHYVIEYGFLENEISDFDDISSNMQYIPDFLTFTILAGAFPPNLMHFYPPDIYTQQRYDWLSWLRAISYFSELRKPSYGDYTIQHPVFVEPSTRSNPSASIRYTSEEEWIIMRGEGLRGINSPGYQQYIGNAQLLCDHNAFCGAEFSFGDQYIYNIAHLQQNTGNPMSWLKAGINHHMVFVCHQLSNLPD